MEFFAAGWDLSDAQELLDRYSSKLNDWETDFLESIIERDRDLSDAQQDVLDKLCDAFLTEKPAIRRR